MSVTDGDIIKGVLEFESLEGVIMQNVFYFLADFLSDELNSAVVSAVEGYLEDLYNALSAYLEDGFTINPGDVDKVAWDAGESKWKVTQKLGQATPTITHTNTADPFPAQVAPVLVANTDRPTSKGRKFIMGCVEAMADHSYLETAAVTAMANALAHYIADETVSGSNVLSPGTIRKAANTFLPFNDGAVNGVVGTQRRRKPGYGA